MQKIFILRRSRLVEPTLLTLVLAQTVVVSPSVYYNSYYTDTIISMNTVILQKNQNTRKQTKYFRGPLNDFFAIKVSVSDLHWTRFET